MKTLEHSYQLELFPFDFYRLDDSNVVLISLTGDYYFSTDEMLNKLANRFFSEIRLDEIAILKSKFLIGNSSDKATLRLLASRLKTKKSTLLEGPSLHIFVPTIECEHSCSYCQVSRKQKDLRYVISRENLLKACDMVFKSPSRTITIEFQGGDPLLRFELVLLAIKRIEAINIIEKRNIRFVISSTLHQLTQKMCEELSGYDVYFSTSIDGPAKIHNSNRPTKTKDSYQKTVSGIELVRTYFGENRVSALMTATLAAIEQPELIVDEYIKLGFRDIFLRPVSSYGFAKKNIKNLNQAQSDFLIFYKRAMSRVRYWRDKGVELNEFMEQLIETKLESPFDTGYVDNQTPSGAGRAVLVYNYDGYVYPSDESRMLVEMGDTSHRLGRIGDSLETILKSSVIAEITEASNPFNNTDCKQCAFKYVCGPDPIAAYNETGEFQGQASNTSHCHINKSLFSDYFFRKLDDTKPLLRPL